jgi:crotonobetainyl-CoA:carnitine CoA-transferase CaiB-like acyl-CoA transferase
MLPLEGIRIIDLSTVVLGPYASQILAEYGADVIKIEAPEGDSTRRTGPSSEPGMGAIFLGVNRGKRSVVLDLKQAAGRVALGKLVDTADVLMHSIRPQKLAAIGLDPQTLRSRNPKLVYVGLHGFAEDGPYGGMPAYDDIIQGLSGCAGLMERQGGLPQYYPTIAADKTTGLVAAHAILAALFKRERSGEGSYVEVPMLESMVAFNLVEHYYGLHFDPPLAGAGYPRLLNKFRKPFRTLDGHLCAMPYTDQHWKRFFTEAGEPALACDARFTNIASRTTHIEALYEIADRIIATRTTEAWLEVCARLEIPASRMNRLEDLPQDEHLRATGFFETIDDAAMGKVRFPGVPVKLDGRRLPVRMPPRLGEHTAQVLAELGIDQPPAAADRPAARGQPAAL